MSIFWRISYKQPLMGFNLEFNKFIICIWYANIYHLKYLDIYKYNNLNMKFILLIFIYYKILNNELLLFFWIKLYQWKLISKNTLHTLIQFYAYIKWIFFTKPKFYFIKLNNKWKFICMVAILRNKLTNKYGVNNIKLFCNFFGRFIIYFMSEHFEIVLIKQWIFI